MVPAGTVPLHLAIIPDGNRRWAKRRGQLGFMGHRPGAQAAQKIFQALRDRGVRYVSFWGCSVSNITKRDSQEVSLLFALFKEYFKKLLKTKELYSDNVRIRALGRWEEYFPPGLQKTVKELVTKTATHDRFHLTFLLAYNGDEEMLAAIRSLFDAKQGQPQLKITAETLKNHLYTRELPPVDLLIRTGGEPHLSTGFMMWDLTEARLYFTDTLWPDFGVEELDRALETFAATERRHGE